MPPRNESGDPLCLPFSDVQENVRQFNEDEAVWRCYARKRALRKQLLPLFRSLNSPLRLTEEQLDQVDWLAAARETRPVRAIGKWIDA